MLKAIIIGISGKSGVGKTTVANIFSECIGTGSSIVLSTDDLHKYERTNSAWKNLTHFNPNANNLELGDFHISNLKNWKNIYRSTYNHISGNFDPPKNISPMPYVINEGLHANYTHKSKGLCDLKIYIETSEELTKHWKIIRDTKFRGKTKVDVLNSMELRKKDAHFVESQKKNSDVIISFTSENNILNIGDETETIKVKIDVYKNTNIDDKYSRLISDFIEYYTNLSDLVYSCKNIGSNPEYVQGPAGNISVKPFNGRMLIKASGTKLKNLDYFTGWSSIDTRYYLDYVEFTSNLDDNKYFSILCESVNNNTIPSMESGFHILLKKYVVHTHPNKLIPILSNINFAKIIKKIFKQYDYCIVPILMPGLDLYDFISKQEKKYDIYFLENHGLIINGNDIKSTLKLHEEICNLGEIWSKNNITKQLNRNTTEYLSPDEHIFHGSKSDWYDDMKKIYNNIKLNYSCKYLDADFKRRLVNLKFEKHRVKR